MRLEFILPPAMTLGQLMRVDSILYSDPDQQDIRIFIPHVTTWLVFFFIIKI